MLHTCGQSPKAQAVGMYATVAERSGKKDWPQPAYDRCSSLESAACQTMLPPKEQAVPVCGESLRYQGQRGWPVACTLAAVFSIVPSESLSHD